MSSPAFANTTPENPPSVNNIKNPTAYKDELLNNNLPDHKVTTPTKYF